LIGVSIGDALDAFVDGTIGSAYAIAASVNRSVVFALVGIGFVFANRANLTNVGGEGQIAMGGIAATAVALYGHVAGLPLGLPFILPMLAAVAAGGLWGGLAGILKTRAGTNEVISTSNSHFEILFGGTGFVSSPKASRWASMDSSRHGGIGGGFAKASVRSRSSQEGKIK
jgi:ABC-type uncharacterized transport system permease subunit